MRVRYNGVTNMRYRSLINVMSLIFLCDYSVCFSQSLEPEDERPSKRPKINHFENTPDDLLIHVIFPHLDARDLSSLSMVCNRFRKLIRKMTIQRLPLKVQFTTLGVLHGVKAIEITTSNGLQFRTPNYGVQSSSGLRKFQTNQSITLGKLPIYINNTTLEVRISIIPDHLTLSFYGYGKLPKCWAGIEELLVGTLTIDSLRKNGTPVTSLTVEANPANLALLLAD